VHLIRDPETAIASITHAWRSRKARHGCEPVVSARRASTACKGASPFDRATIGEMRDGTLAESIAQGTVNFSQSMPPTSASNAAISMG